MQFVFDNVVPGGGGGSDGVVYPDLSNTWILPQSTQISASNYVYNLVLPESSDTYSKPFNFVASSFANTDASKNFVFRMGHNIANGGGPVDATRSTIHDEWEQHYISSGVEVVERHMAFTTATGTLQRYLTFFGRSDGSAPASSNENVLGLIADQIYIRDRTNVSEYLRVDAATGFSVKNLDAGLRTEMTATGNGLTLAMAAGGTGNFLQLAYNFSTFTTINKFGEIAITPSGQAGTGGQAMFRLRGRTGTTHSVQIEATTGNPMLSISADESYHIHYGNTFYFRKGDVLVQNASNVTQFAIEAANGRIWTNQVTAGTVLGAVVGGMRVNTTAGVLIGYAGIYASIS